MAVTWNPLDVGSTVILSNGNLTLKNDGGYVTGNGRANIGISSGKKYWEIHWDSGVYLATAVANAVNPPSGSWSFSGNAKIYAWDGKIYPGGTLYGVAPKIGDTIGVALDMDSGTLQFYLNGVSQGVASTDILTSVGATVYPYVVSGDSNYFICTANFGATAFAYPIPDGYTALDSGTPTTIDITVTSIKASTTNQAINPVISTSKTISIVSIISTATSQAINPAITISNNYNAIINSVIATVSNQAINPIITGQRIVSIVSTRANSTSQSINPIITGQRIVSIVSTRANSTSQSKVPLISAIINKIAQINISESIRKQVIKATTANHVINQFTRRIRTEVM